MGIVLGRTKKGDIAESGEAVRYCDQKEGVINFLIAFQSGEFQHIGISVDGQ